MLSTAARKPQKPPKRRCATITERKEKALQALLVTRTRAEAAKVAGIGESTLRSYFHDANFAKRYQDELTSLTQDAAHQAQQTISPALQTLARIMEDEEQPASSRIAAARSLLEYAIKFETQSRAAVQQAQAELFLSYDEIRCLAREPNYEQRLLLYDSAYEVDATIANDIIYSIVHGISYDDIRKIRYIPVGKSAFYDKRKMALAQFRDRMRIYGAL